MLQLDLTNRNVALIHAYIDPADEIASTSQGALSILPNANVFMGYGNVPEIKEYGSRGEVRMSIAFGEEGLEQSYRAYKQTAPGFKLKLRTVFSFEFLSMRISIV